MNLDKRGVSMLVIFVQENKPETVESLLKTGHFDVDERDYVNNERTVLITAAWKGYIAVVKILLRHGANVNLSDDLGRTALLHSCIEGYYEVVQELLNDGAAVNTITDKGGTALTVASTNGHHKIVSLLIEKGAILDLSGSPGRTALWAAVVNNRF